MRRYPQGSVRGTELSLDEKGQSASSGSSRRLPARRLVVAGPPGTPAHWHISTGRAAVLLAVNGLLPRESLLHPFREVRRCFFQAARPTTPGAADSRARSPPGLSRLTAETLLTPGRRNDPCGTCPPSPPPLWAGRPLTSSHRRDRPAPSPTISRTTRNPEPIRAPHSRHSPILSRHQNTGSPLSKKHQAPQSWPSPTSRHGACPPRQPQAPLHNRSGNPHSRPRDHIHIRPMNRPPRVGYDHELLDEPPEGRSITSSALFGNNRRARSAACQEVSCSPCGIISLTT